MMLKVENLQVYYGAIHALQGISFHLEKGEIVALIGANGAGKSTTLNTISGILRPREGAVTFLDEEIQDVPAQEIVRKGIIQVPEGRKIFSRMTVTENLEMGAYTQADRASINRDMESVFERFSRLRERRNQLGGTLSGGEDEPSMGLSPILVEQIFDIIQDINEQGTSILLVEQNAQMALAIADRAYVLETGKIMMQGNGDDLLKDSNVIDSYLGGH
ncbi:MAG: ABC transporter ATP-binding protein [Chloroflexi bacterium]|nr:ABC transporter ATP-binding protein [Chloroflexota bacterium]